LIVGQLIVPYSFEPELEKTQSWRIMFGSPALIALINLIGVAFVFKLDSPVFYNQSNQFDKL